MELFERKESLDSRPGSFPTEPQQDKLTMVQTTVVQCVKRRPKFLQVHPPASGGLVTFWNFPCEDLSQGQNSFHSKRQCWFRHTSHVINTWYHMSPPNKCKASNGDHGYSRLDSTVLNFICTRFGSWPTICKQSGLAKTSANCLQLWSKPQKRSAQELGKQYKGSAFLRFAKFYWFPATEQ